MQHRVEGVEEFMIEKPGFEKFGVKMSLNPQGHRGFFLKAFCKESAILCSTND